MESLYDTKYLFLDIGLSKILLEVSRPRTFCSATSRVSLSIHSSSDSIVLNESSMLSVMSLIWKREK